MNIKYTPKGFCLLNIGCGDHYSKVWNNVDLYIDENITYHDITRDLPYSDNTFDGVYSSHVLEHLPPSRGEKHLRDIYRVLKPGGVFRLVVPDLEMICREYLKQLEMVSTTKNETNVQRYHWIVAELIDQMVREKPGGVLLDILNSGDYDPDFVKYRNGDLIAELEAPEKAGPKSLWARLRRLTIQQFVAALSRRIKRLFYGELVYSPQFSGEAHKWMYDRVSLQILLEKCQFKHYAITEYNVSDISNWDDYQLDQSAFGDAPRKPDSIYIEVIK